MIEDNSEFYEPERRELAPGTRCASHPDREAKALCEECHRPVCDECAPLKGGGHAFCRDCLAGSRLVESAPNVLGGAAQEPPAGSQDTPAHGAVPRDARRPGGRTCLLLALLGLAALAAWFVWTKLTGRM